MHGLASIFRSFASSIKQTADLTAKHDNCISCQALQTTSSTTTTKWVVSKCTATAISISNLRRPWYCTALNDDLMNWSSYPRLPPASALLPASLTCRACPSSSPRVSCCAGLCVPQDTVDGMMTATQHTPSTGIRLRRLMCLLKSRERLPHINALPDGVTIVRGPPESEQDAASVRDLALCPIHMHWRGKAGMRDFMQKHWRRAQKPLHARLQKESRQQTRKQRIRSTLICKARLCCLYT